MRNIPDNFKFFVPLGTVKKAKDAKGNQIMRIGGIASTNDIDADEEMLDPNGFQLDYFLQSGYVNWHHQAAKDPSAIIGEPTKAEITQQGLYIEADLYQDSKKAKDVYQLADTLKKNKSNRKLGFSIEGKVLDRDPNDPRRVTAAKITGVAVTPTPKNSNTLVDIIKGHYNPYEEEMAVTTPQGNPEDGEANGGNVNIIDVERPDGVRMVVTADYQIIVKKAQTTTNTAALALESLDGDAKNLQEPKKNIKKALQTQDNSSIFTHELSKAEVFEQIFQITSDAESAFGIFQIIKQINNSDMGKFTKEDIQKAMELLDLVKGNDSMDESLDNASKNPKGTAEKEEAENATKNPKGNAEETSKMNYTQKSDDDEMGEEEGDEVEKGGYEDMFKDYGRLMKMDGAKMTSDDYQNMSSMYTQMKAMCKSMEKDLNTMQIGMDAYNEANGGKQTIMEKGLDVDIIKGLFTNLLEERNEEVEEKFAALGQISKASLEQLTDLKKAIEGLSEIKSEFSQMRTRLNELENQPASGRKSFTSQAYLKKAFEQGGGEAQKVSLASSKNQVLDWLDKKSGIGTEKYNPKYGNAVAQFEAAGTLSKSIINEFQQENNVILIP